MKRIFGILCFNTIFLLNSCAHGQSLIGVYSPKGNPESNTKVILKENNRFVFHEFQHLISATTSGSFEISDKMIKLYSDKIPNDSSRVEYLESHKTDGLKVKVIYEDLTDVQIPIPATVRVSYLNGGTKSFTCNDEGVLSIATDKLVGLEVRWVGGMPLRISTSEMSSNNLKVILVEESMGNTVFEGKELRIKSGKLVEVNGSKRVFKKIRQ